MNEMGDIEIFSRSGGLPRGCVDTIIGWSVELPI